MIKRILYEYSPSINFKIYKNGYWSYLDKEEKIVNNSYKIKSNDVE